ncbi:MAG: pentapeptide repeat-containing protein [Pseudomonadota bacterium]
MSRIDLASTVELQLPNEAKERITRLIQTDSSDFRELALAAGFDPATSFRGKTLRNIDFGTSDLSGFDFSGADLRGSKLARAKIDGAVFDGALRRNSKWSIRHVEFRTGSPLGSGSEMIEYSPLGDFIFTNSRGGFTEKLESTSALGIPDLSAEPKNSRCRLVEGKRELTLRLEVDGKLIVVDEVSGKATLEFELEDPLISTAFFSPDRRSIVAISHSGIVTIVALPTGSIDLRFEAPGELVTDAYIDNRRGCLALARSDARAEFYDLSSQQLLLAVETKGSAATAVTLLDNSRFAVTGSNDGTVELWEIETGVRIRLLHKFGTCVHSIAASPLDRSFAAIDESGSGRIWRF